MTLRNTYITVEPKLINCRCDVSLVVLSLVALRCSRVGCIVLLVKTSLVLLKLKEKKLTTDGQETPLASLALYSCRLLPLFVPFGLVAALLSSLFTVVNS